MFDTSLIDKMYIYLHFTHPYAEEKFLKHIFFVKMTNSQLIVEQHFYDRDKSVEISDISPVYREIPPPLGAQWRVYLGPTLKKYFSFLYP